MMSADAMVGLMMLLFGFVLYMLPTIIAYSRMHKNTLAIGIVNFFLGWSLIGWVGALVWAIIN